MGNRLRDMFDPEHERRMELQLKEIKQHLIDKHHCRFCVHSVERPHYEMGYDAGTDVYCMLDGRNKLICGVLEDPCLFWEYDGS